MSEEILKALTELFAIITKQDSGVSENERQYVINLFQTELDQDSIQAYIDLYDEQSGYRQADTVEARKTTSVKESIRILGICKKINKTLTQKQKVVVLIKLFELVSADKNLSAQRMEIIHTVSSVFNINPEEHHLIEQFISTEDPHMLHYPDVLLANSDPQVPATKTYRLIYIHLPGTLAFLRVKSVDLFFVKYWGEESTLLNGFVMKPAHVYLFSHGSTVKTQAGDALYYSDIVADFNEEIKTTRLSFNARIEEHRFSNGHIGLREVVISEGPGKLVGIMGASGAGKTTLMSVLVGLIRPTRGKVRINGFDIFEEKEKIEGVIGYVAQDDLLIEELTVYENLYYNTKLCLANLNEKQLQARVMEVLGNLGLDHLKNLKVGSILDNVISGGQRKRLNIALELIREPAILFLDEPTSGLSSRDSENVIDLLKELSQKGKLVFVVIHQPSSDIYKMFDKMIIMDTGGYPAFYGHPLEAVTYFKRSTLQVDSNRGQCETCGNVNPEQIFSIMEAKVVDEYGQPTTKRKINPAQWHNWYRERFTLSKVDDLLEAPPRSLKIPNPIRQAWIFAMRDMLSKLSNKQYLLINLLEAPLLAFILAFVIKYKSAPGGREYLFRYNDNFPAFILISIIVALFMGLTVSAEEIIRDRKILKRESFLNLSWNSYLISKLAILFTLSAFQTLLFTLVGHLILEIEWSMILPFWFALFTVSCMSNVMGLNISSAFNSAVTVYILIPLLIIPQLIFSGLLFKYEKLHTLISHKSKVPLIADLMVSRWAYEALAVYQFVNNSYEKPIYDFERYEAQADFRATLLADELQAKRRFIRDHIHSQHDSVKQAVAHSLEVIRNSIKDDYFQRGLEPLDLSKPWTPQLFTDEFDMILEAYLNQYKEFYQEAYNKAINDKEELIHEMENEPDAGYDQTVYMNRYANESLSDLMRNVAGKERIIEHQGELIQKVNPVFLIPKNSGFLSYRTHFFAPVKVLFNRAWDTYFFNIGVIWFMAVVFYIILYFEGLKKVIKLFSR
jgi:ABC transport system ATP-binding/permease protein